MTEPTAPRPPLPVLQGQRCLLRAIVPDDAEALVRHADNVHVARRMFDGFPSPYTEEAARAWAGEEANSGRFGDVWAIEVDGALVGCAGLVQASGWLRCNAEIGYWIGEAHWRRGITSDAVRQIVDWAFAVRPELTRIFAGIFADNEGSMAVARRCGFVREGVLKQSAIKDGKAIDRVLWATYRPQVERRTADIDAALAISAANAMERA